MKTFIKITRSIITSLLFILIIIATFVHCAFTTTMKTTGNIEKMINREKLLNELTDQNLEKIPHKDIVIDYLDDYIKYVFHKKSYPSLQNIDYKEMTEDKKREIENIINTIKDKIDLDYDTVITIRSINNFISNRSIYLLINIGIFLLFLISSITTGSFKKGMRILSLGILAGGLISSVLATIMNKSIDEILKGNLYNMFSLAADDYYSQFINLTFVYMSIGLISFLTILILEKVFRKNQI